MSSFPSPPSPPPPSIQHSTLNSFFLLIVSTIVLVLIFVTLLFNSAAFHRAMSTILCLGSGRRDEAPKVSEAIPVCRYQKKQSFSTECSVCLTAFREGEKVRQLPACRHSFHAPCIDMWLYSHSSCPFCRAIVLQIPPGCQKGAAIEQQQVLQNGEVGDAIESSL